MPISKLLFIYLPAMEDLRFHPIMNLDIFEVISIIKGGSLSLFIDLGSFMAIQKVSSY